MHICTVCTTHTDTHTHSSSTNSHEWKTSPLKMSVSFSFKAPWKALIHHGYQQLRAVATWTFRKCITLWCLFQVCYSARPLKGCSFSLHVLSLEVQGRAPPDAQKCIRRNCEIKCFVFHYCSSKCLDPNRKDEFVWYQHGNASAFIVLWCLCQHELVTADVHVWCWWHICFFICVLPLFGQHIWWIHTRTHTH